MKRIELAGRQFDKWHVIEYSHSSKHGDAYWLCECECGTRKAVTGGSLLNGKSKSCGCNRGSFCKALFTTHGLSSSAEYDAWQHMLRRCNDPKDKSYCNYGGRGIKVEYGSFEEFFADVGLKPTSQHSIERIDNNGNYKPGNCRWATPKEQVCNTRQNVWLELNGEVRLQSEWSELLGWNKAAITKLLKRGWSVEKALTVPLKDNGYKAY